MSDALCRAPDRDAFLDWAEVRPERTVFDGTAPVGLNGGSVDHSRITGHADAATRGGAIRYSDVLVRPARSPGRSSSSR